MNILKKRKSDKEKSLVNELIFKFINRRKLIFIFLVIFVLFAEIVGTFMAQHFNKQIYGNAFLKNINIYSSTLIILAYVFCQNSNYLSDIIKRKLFFASVEKSKNDVRNYLFNYVIKQSTKYFNNNLSGDLNNKINTIVDNFAKLIDVLNNMIFTFFILLLTPILYANISVYLSLSFLIVSILYIIVLTKTRKSLSAKSKLLAEAESKYIGFANDDFVNISNIKIFGIEKFESNKSDNILENCEEVNFDYLSYFGKHKIVNFIMVFSLLFSVLCIAGILLVKGKIEFGTFMFCTTVVSITRYILDEISFSLMRYSKLTGMLDNSLNKLLQPIEILNTSSKKLNIQNGKVEFKNVDFRY